MHEELVLKKRILEKAYEMFYHMSISKVTMGEIANALGISKKTLYKYYENKEDIIKAMYKAIIEEIDCEMEALVNDSEMNFSVKMKRIMDILAKGSAKLKGELIDEMKLSYPEFYKDILDFRKKCSKDRFSLLIDEGVNKSYFRTDIDKDLFALLYTTAIHNIIIPDVLSELSLSGSQVYLKIIDVLFNGFLTEEGRQNFKCC